MCIRDSNFQCVDLHVPTVIRAVRPNAGAGTGTAKNLARQAATTEAVSYTHLRAHETRRHL
eukprot:5586545-Prorocentrum_lima.AAC.1